MQTNRLHRQLDLRKLVTTFETKGQLDDSVQGEWSFRVHKDCRDSRRTRDTKRTSIDAQERDVDDASHCARQKVVRGRRDDDNDDERRRQAAMELNCCVFCQELTVGLRLSTMTTPTLLARNNLSLIEKNIENDLFNLLGGKDG